MSSWLKLLPLEMQDVVDLVEPTEELKEGETVVGVISEDLRKVYTLWQTMEKQSEILAVEIKYTKESDQNRAKLFEMKTKAKGLEMIFWIGAMDELGLWGHVEQRGIRTGWKIVEYPRQGTPIFGFFPPQI